MKEVERYGKEASEANRKLVDGKIVRLELDVEQFDRYGRTLAGGGDVRERMAMRR